MFAEIWKAIPSLPWQDYHYQAWISPETWSLINARVEACLQGCQHSSQALARTIKAGLQGDRCRRATKAGLAVESLLASNFPPIRKAWIWMRVWYKDAIDCPPPPSRVALATMTAEREELYWHFPSPGEPIPVGGLPLSVDYVIPEDEDIAWGVRRLLLNRSVGTSGMQSEHLRQWLIAAIQDDSPDTTNFLNVVTTVQAAFRDGTLAE